MHDLKWSASEKVLARRVFEAALAAELAEVLAELKAKAAAAALAEDVWAIEGFLRERRRAIDEKYDLATRCCCLSSGACFARAESRKPML